MRFLLSIVRSFVRSYFEKIARLIRKRKGRRKERHDIELDTGNWRQFVVDWKLVA